VCVVMVSYGDCFAMGGFPGLCIGAMMYVCVVFCFWSIWGVFYVLGLMGELGWFGESTWRVLGCC
jgi:hypothetical protein